LTHGAGHDEVLGELIRSIPELRGNILHDVHTAALMKEHGLTTIYTRDTDFHRFPFLQVLDPVT
jgi:predicted nucleic acid-binding protein